MAGPSAYSGGSMQFFSQGSPSNQLLSDEAVGPCQLIESEMSCLGDQPDFTYSGPYHAGLLDQQMEDHSMIGDG